MDNREGNGKINKILTLLICKLHTKNLLSLDNAFLFVLIVAVRTLWFWGEGGGTVFGWNCFYCNSFFKKEALS